MYMFHKACDRRPKGMTDQEQPSSEIGRKLGNIFVDVTGETTITDHQDREEETSKKVKNVTDTRPRQEEE